MCILEWVEKVLPVMLQIARTCLLVGYMKPMAFQRTVKQGSLVWELGTWRSQLSHKTLELSSSWLHASIHAKLTGVGAV